MLKRIIAFLSSEEFIIALLALALLTFSYGPLVYQYLFPPPGTIFIGSFGYPLDFLGNLSVYHEGRIGQWFVNVPLSSTLPMPPLYHKELTILIGQASRLFPIEPTIFFHLVRFILSCLFILSAYFLISKIFSQKAQRIGAFALALFSTAASLGYDKLTDFWSPLSVFQRSAYFHHYLAAFILTVWAIVLLSRFLTNYKKKTFLLLCFLGFLITSIHPANGASLVLTLPIFLAFDSWQSKKINLAKIFSLGLFSIITLLPMLYIYWAGQNFPLNTLSKLDLQFDIGRFISPVDFLFGIGPTLILALAGIYFVAREKKVLGLLIAPWAIVYIVGFFFLGRFAGFNSGRFLQTPFFIFLGILSVYPLWFVARGKSKVFYLLVIILLALSLSNYKASLALNFENFRTNYSWINADPALFEGIDWLGQNSKPGQVVLAEELDALLIMSYAGNLTYINSYSSQAGDAYPALKFNAESFLQQKFSEKEAKEFIENKNISFIFSQGPLSYSFLRPVFQNTQVVIYSFAK
ncbi:MAG: hypothetical protein Q8Q24_00765 [bacterium]|nr:hypothetical protein [bacterium]